MARVKIPLQFNDREMGHPSYGFIPRNNTRTDGSADDEDAEYLRYLRKRFPEIAARHPVVVSGNLWLDPEPAARKRQSGTLRVLPELPETRAQRLAADSDRMPEPDGQAEEQHARILRAREEINAGTHLNLPAGSASRFELITRACDLVARGWKPDIVADALYEELAERGLMPFDSGDGP